MRITFPYMGPAIAYKKAFELLGHDVVCPPRPTQRTIDLGVKYSPEFACFPFKVLMGSYVEAIELGADTIISSGGKGPCRAGFYGEVHKRILQNMGYDVDVVIFDSFFKNKEAFMNNLKLVKGHNSWLKLIWTGWTIYNMIYALDDLYKYVTKMRPYEVERGSFTKSYGRIADKFDKEIKTLRDVKRLRQESFDYLKSIPVNEPEEDERIQIGIVGEIFVVMEPSINMEMEAVLNNLGCEVTRSQYLSEWLDHNAMPKFIAKSSEEEVLKKGEKYIEIGIGGHAKENVGSVVNFKDMGYDGVVHLMPFACLPELVSQSIMPSISKENDIPVITIAIDEQTGIANNLTRLEAFIDLIKSKKKSTGGK